MFKIIVSFALLFICTIPAFAEKDNVQIDLDSLNAYEPPPMFGSAPKKNKKNSPVTIYTQDLEEKDVVQPTAADILRQLDSINSGPISAPPPSVTKPEPVEETIIDKPRRVYARPAIKKGNVHTTAREIEIIEQTTFAPLNYTLQFLPGSEGLTPEQEAGIRAAVFPAAMIKDVRLLIYSYATGTDGTESEARRMSLRRAIQAKVFLLGLNVPDRNINILALGDHAPIPPENKLVFVTKM